MRAPDALQGVRVVADPSVLDGLTWPDAVAPLRLAPDDLFALGATQADVAAALVEEETGFVGWWLALGELYDHLREHIDWPLPESLPALAQGLIAGVPAKLWLTNDRALLFCAAAYAHELEERLP